MLCALKKLGHGEHWSGKSAYRPREVHDHLGRTFTFTFTLNALGQKCRPRVVLIQCQVLKRAFRKTGRKTRTNSSDSSPTPCKTPPYAGCPSGSRHGHDVAKAKSYADHRRRDLPAKIKHTTWVYQTWGGEVRSRVVCQKCRKPSDTFDNFLDLSLDMPKNGQKHVKTMLQNFIREDRLEGDNKYNCEK